MDSPPPPNYDIIFAGGGTTACVIAGRLAAADSTLRIMVIDNGHITKENPLHLQPARYIKTMESAIPSLRTDKSTNDFTFHRARVGLTLGRSPAVSNASCVGGGSSVNAMFYNRAPASDYDDWMRLGNPGWGSQDMIALAKKLETYQAGVINSTHGSSGPIKVSYGCHETKLGKEFLVAAAALPRGRGFTEDMNDFSSCNVYGRLPKYIDASTGRRSDAAHAYLYPHTETHNPNFHVLDNTRVNRLLFEIDAENRRRAVGVEYQTGGRNSPMQTARVSRLVVLSAGTFCSPAILERSGVGNKDVLEKHAIPLVCHLPGVGENYNDHHAVFAPYLVPHGTTLDGLGTEGKDEVFEAQWKSEGNGPLAANSGVDAGIKLRPNAQDLEQLTPLFSERWETFFAHAPDKPIAFVGPVAPYFGGYTETRNSIYSMLYFTTYPKSTGSVHITSADPFAPLEVDTALLDLYAHHVIESRLAKTNEFNRDEDLVVLRWAYKWSRELARRTDSYRGEYAPEHPQFGCGSQARCGEADGPVDISVPEIQYSAADDAAIDAYHRKTAGMGWHSLGTCAMKPQEASGVVDSRLNVYGVDNLKVADLSVAPLNVGANTTNTALIIGEKAAMIIAEELGICGI
ncbi:Alcohol oxidase [Mycena venus]|uniref:Alcohol oxidase n=1 Tax=Mycena venus TaxID=2733690 RepID=A0A8H6XQ32_9AGAR|nr:Alcohol oxidase [Mycena venus]